MGACNGEYSWCSCYFPCIPLSSFSIASCSFDQMPQEEVGQLTVSEQDMMGEQDTLLLQQ